MQSWITICDTCKIEGWSPEVEIETSGAQLAGLIESKAAAHPMLSTRRVSCMMGCQRSCNVAVQGDGKLGYVLGLFNPTDADADAIIEYALAHQKSTAGQVPYRQWPEGVKGHFTSRMAPLPKPEF